MNIQVFATCEAMSEAAARAAASELQSVLAEKDSATIVLATGNSQRDMLAALARSTTIAWNRVTAFHLDEYIGLPIEHPASLRHFLWREFVSRLPVPLQAMHYLAADRDAVDECQRMGERIAAHVVDLALVGIGENGHLAFNDPPADFHAGTPYHIVQLDAACRRQQVGEGWFATVEDVPQRAISMSIPQIMKARAILATVPDRRKAKAVQEAVQGPVTPDLPASILQRHSHVSVFLDAAAASLLSAP